ncbi:MAG: cbb3-type cytochrome c oxidase subunit I, partial [Methylococcaceae bacterium]|nr:cbb3-type cytochrome c oxidase subunit I [Methylococcaceae bacterium]
MNAKELCEKSRACFADFKAWVALDSTNLSDGQQLAVKYFIVAVILFFAQLLFGMIAATQFIFPNFLYDWLDFSVNRMVHINAMIVWML